MCTGLGTGYFDQDPNWLLLGSASYSIEGSPFTGPLVPSLDMAVIGDTSYSLVQSMPVDPENFTSDFEVNTIEEVTADVPLLC